MVSAHPRHAEACGTFALCPARAFDLLDDHRRLASHMTSRSWMMGGSSMALTLDEHCGRAVGSRIRMRGRVLGISLDLEEVVTLREPPWRKTWETLGEPVLLVLAGYRMGFEIEPAGKGSKVTIAIDYSLPRRGVARWLGRALSGPYSRWCVRRMLGDLGRDDRASGGSGRCRPGP
jgi:hypothetical protein